MLSKTTHWVAPPQPTKIFALAAQILTGSQFAYIPLLHAVVLDKISTLYNIIWNQLLSNAGWYFKCIAISNYVNEVQDATGGYYFHCPEGGVNAGVSTFHDLTVMLLADKATGREMKSAHHKPRQGELKSPTCCMHPPLLRLLSRASVTVTCLSIRNPVNTLLRIALITERMLLVLPFKLQHRPITWSYTTKEPIICRYTSK